MKLKAVPKAEKTKEEKSKMGRRSRNKGSNYERTIAKRFKAEFNVDLVRTPQSGGFAKQCERADDFRGDIIPVEKNIDFKLHIECKNSKNWSLPAWLRQAEEDCPKERIPIVVFHQHGTSQDYVCVKLENFLSLIPKDAIIKEKQV